MNPDRYLSTFQTVNAVAESRSQSQMIILMLMIVAAVIVVYINQSNTKAKDEAQRLHDKEVDELKRRYEREAENLQRRLTETAVDLKNARHYISLLRLDATISPTEAAGFDNSVNQAASVQSAQPAPVPTAQKAATDSTVEARDSEDVDDPRVRQALSSM